MTVIHAVFGTVAYVAPFAIVGAFLLSVWRMRPSGRRWTITAASLGRADVPAPGWVLVWLFFTLSLLPVLGGDEVFDRIDQAGRVPS